MIRFVFPLLAGIALLAPTARPTAAEQPAAISADQAREELDLVYGLLREMHPGADRYITPNALAELVGRIREGIGDDEIAIPDWLLTLSRVTAAVCDEHTFVHYYFEDLDEIEEANQTPGFYEPLVFVEGVPYLTSRTGEDVAGLRVLDVDGVPGNRLYEELVERMSVDGCARIRRVLYSGHQGLELLAARLGSRESYVIRAESSQGEIRDLTVAARRIGPVLDESRRRKLEDRDVLTEAGFLRVVNNGAVYYALNRGDSIGYLRLLDFKIEDEAALESTMRRLIEDNPRDLIVDFQSNPGGLNTKTSLFLSFLLQRPHGFTGSYHTRRLTIPSRQYFVWENGGQSEFEKDMRQFRKARKRNGFYTLRGRERAFGNPDYDGRITVLIDPATGSAAGAAATILKSYRDVRIIGTQAHAGGAFFCFRPRGHYVLPYSRFVVAIPHMCASRNGEVARRFRNAVEPDLSVAMTPAAFQDLPAHTIKTAIDDILERRATTSTN